MERAKSIIAGILAAPTWKSIPNYRSGHTTREPPCFSLWGLGYRVSFVFKLAGLPCFPSLIERIRLFLFCRCILMLNVYYSMHIQQIEFSLSDYVVRRSLIPTLWMIFYSLCRVCIHARKQTFFLIFVEYCNISLFNIITF